MLYSVCIQEFADARLELASGRIKLRSPILGSDALLVLVYISPSEPDFNGIHDIRLE